MSKNWRTGLPELSLENVIIYIYQLLINKPLTIVTSSILKTKKNTIRNPFFRFPADNIDEPEWIGRIRGFFTSKSTNLKK